MGIYMKDAKNYYTVMSCERKLFSGYEHTCCFCGKREIKSSEPYYFIKIYNSRFWISENCYDEFANKLIEFGKKLKEDKNTSFID